MKQRDKFMGGTITPEELHQELSFPIGARCQGCGGPPLVKYTSFADEAEMLKRDPNLLVCRTAEPEKYQSMRLVNRHGVFLRISMTYACRGCSKDADKAAAKHPDWVVVLIDRGPGPDKLVFGPGT